MTKKRAKTTIRNASFFIKKEIELVNTEPQKKRGSYSRFEEKCAFDLTQGSADFAQEFPKRIDEIKNELISGFKEKYGLDLTKNSAISIQSMEDTEAVSEGMDLSYP